MQKYKPLLRDLYVTILIYCQPSNPKELFEKHYQEWTDDFIYRAEKKGKIYSEEELRTLVCLDVEERLQNREFSLTNFGITLPTLEQIQMVQSYDIDQLPRIVKEELEFDWQEMKELAIIKCEQYTPEQYAIHNTVMEHLHQNKPLYLFIDARGGCGKTFLLNGILAAVRSSEPNGAIALAMATTGIAANLLMLGRTFHSRMKVPITSPTKEQIFPITGQSGLAELIKRAKLLIIDESTMMHKYHLEALDRTLRDIVGIEEPFGNKIIILSGDFRQCLPVVRGANRAQIVDVCISKSYIWSTFRAMSLTENMRVKALDDSVLQEFDNWTLSVGDGTVPIIKSDNIIELKPEMCIEINSDQSETHAIKTFCQTIFPDIDLNYKITKWLENRAILAPTNRVVNKINECIVDMIPGSYITLFSSDLIDNPQDLFRYNIEYVNTLEPSGMPNHVLKLKKGMIIMLIRNLNPNKGLCNGTRLTLNRVIGNFLLECTYEGPRETTIVFIPRITLKPESGQYPFEWSRRQFPVKLAGSFTINKSQGQTLNTVGVWLSDPVFTHGQLYVAISRVGGASNIKFAIKKEKKEISFTTRNIVYKNVLLSNNLN